MYIYIYVYMSDLYIYIYIYMCVYVAETSARDHWKNQVITRAALGRPPEQLRYCGHSDQGGLRPPAKAPSTHQHFQHSRHHHFVFYSSPQRNHLRNSIVKRCDCKGGCVRLARRTSEDLPRDVGSRSALEPRPRQTQGQTIPKTLFVFVEIPAQRIDVMLCTCSPIPTHITHNMNRYMSESHP